MKNQNGYYCAFSPLKKRLKKKKKRRKKCSIIQLYLNLWKTTSRNLRIKSSQRIFAQIVRVTQGAVIRTTEVYVYPCYEVKIG